MGILRQVAAFAIAAPAFASIGVAGTSVQQAPVAADRQLQIVADVDRGAKPPAPADAAKTAYLLSYFKEHVHALHFAVSRDGYTFTDVNDGRPVLAGTNIAEQKGIRDPHLMRGPDGAFYLAMTDLHIYAREEGLRTTQWERPEPAFGWGNNRKLILMRSRDLVHWTHAAADITRLFPAYRNAGAAWAPETIYDPVRKRMMVYFTTRLGAGPNYLVYSYADPAFRTLTAAPQRLFRYPRPAVSTIDADITRVGDRYHMFYVAHEPPGYLRQAVSDRVNGGYVYDPARVDPEKVGTEAPTLWRRHGTDAYVLMYDVFGAKPNNMGFSETRDFRTFRNIGRFNDPGSPMKTTNFTAPKHGSVTAITPAEADRLEAYFKGR